MKIIEDHPNYVLKNRIPIKEPDLIKWGNWMGKTDRRVNETSIINPITKEETRISTVFLGLNYNFTGKGDPLLFETKIFGGKSDGYPKKCSTWEEAVKMHQTAIEKCSIT